MHELHVIRTLIGDGRCLLQTRDVCIGGPRFAGLVIDEGVVDLAAAYPHFARSNGATSGVLSDPTSVLGLLQDWDRNFPVLQLIAAFVVEQGIDNDTVKATVYQLSALQVLPPIIRPPKLLYAAANYREHVAGMRKTFRNGLPPIEPSNDYQADKTKSDVYLFFQRQQLLSGPYNDVVLPEGVDRIDWEAELAVVIGRQEEHSYRPGDGPRRRVHDDERHLRAQQDLAARSTEHPLRLDGRQELRHLCADGAVLRSHGFCAGSLEPAHLVRRERGLRSKMATAATWCSGSRSRSRTARR